MKLKNLIILVVLSFSLLLEAKLVQRGYVRSEAGILFEKDGEYSHLQNKFSWVLEYKNGDIESFINPVFSYDQMSQNLDISLNQLYFDLFFDNFDLRIGKQQIIWGKADGVFITDVISPGDKQNFILPDFDEIRIALNALKLDYYMGNSTVELVLIPTFTAAILPKQGSIWTPQKTDFPIETIIDNDNERVENKLENGEIALKYSYLSGFVDFEVMGAYLWGDLPAKHIYPILDIAKSKPVKVVIKPEYHRLPLLGGSFSKAVFGAVLRGEFAYYFDKKFPSGDISDFQNFPKEGLQTRNYVHYLLGYDHSWWGVNVSMQGIQEYIVKYDSNIHKDEFSDTFTFLASKTFLGENLKTSMFIYCGINDNDFLIRPKISYDFGDGFNALLGANIFVGDKGNFGQYDSNDMIYAKIRYDF